MKVANGKNSSADFYILVELSGAKKLIVCESLLQSLLAEWCIASGAFYVSDDTEGEKLRELRESLTKDTVEIVGSMQYAGYNAPWTPPWMIRNEVMVEIR